MAENDTNNQCTDPDYPPIDLQLISQAVVNIHIARRTLLIYPSTHEQVKNSIKRAFGLLSKTLANIEPLTLTVMKDGIGVAEQLLPNKNPAFKNLAGVLKRYQIAMVTFGKDISINELARFLQLITVDRDKVTVRGGIVAVAEKRNLPHIQIKTIDYSKLLLTEEQEIARTEDKEGEEGSIWQQFVSQIAAVGLSEGEGLSSQDDSNIDPDLLARMLNNQELDLGKAIDHYQLIFKNTGESISDQQLMTNGLIKFQKMIMQLNPELQNQFLSATFKNCAQTATMSDTASLIDGLGGELILRMLAQADADGEKISPSLLAFVQKMGQIGLSAVPQTIAGHPAGESSQGFTDDNVASLLTPEQHETYVDEGYAELLNSLTAKASREVDAENFAREVDAALTDSQINIHTGRAMTRLMANSNDTAGYRSWARQLTYLLDDLLESRSFAYLAELLVMMRNEQHACDDERAKIAKLVLERFNDPQFVADAVQKARRPDGQMVADALTLLLELGESVAVELLEELDPAETFSGHAFYDKLLENLGAVTAKEALARIKDPRPDYVRRMIRIIRRVGDADTVEHLKPLLEHGDIDVRMEALATLLKFGNNWGLIWLRDRLSEPWSDDIYRVVLLAGRYRVREVVPQLIEYLKRRGGMGRREAALGALGRIGDPAAISAMTKLAHRRWSLSQKQARRLKRVIFENLEGYAFADIKDLLHLGMKQKDPVIRSVCEKLFKDAGRKPKSGDIEE